ncbi:acetolactate synthase small subunit [Serpentinicella alkaliphila]|uniref:Acetolactate synthase small subunit n=1 Tax=Serpentinicella alkaliphila TaxID=1734049 RepID=A0A4R2TNI3_9FIRM|nr:acetolactate synthase small subunit [Serpentinicella alkaliphila]QUH24454.1 acetolactate synthase small subunit [Serpentinicella alkaliphila]TCQ04152.1 acetolactate synthase small subunit [Serpentinicella alkaliphila]
MQKHILSVLVENQPGVLSRVAGLFSRRGYNIDSLSVGETENPAYSRMTIVVHGDDLTLEQIKKQLAKLVDVIKVVELKEEDAVQRELALIKVKADSKARTSVIEVVAVFRAKIIDVATESLTVEITGDKQKIAAFIEIMKTYEIKEIVRTGLTAIGRSYI